VQRLHRSIEKHRKELSPPRNDTAARIRQPLGEIFENPGERLYRTGVQANREKRRLIEEVRRELEEREIRDHCTFQPRLTAWDYYYQKERQMRADGIEVDIGGTRLAPEHGSNMSMQMPPPIVENPSQAAMPQGDDDDLFDDVEENVLDEEIVMRPSITLDSLGEGCCTGEVPSEMHEQLAQAIPVNDQSLDDIRRSLKNESLDQTVLDSLNASLPRRHEKHDYSFGGNQRPRTSSIQSFGAHHHNSVGINDAKQLQLLDLDESREAALDSKFNALYNDAKYRNVRKEQIYANCLDAECTFKPELVTKSSKLSQTTVKKARDFLAERSAERKRQEEARQLDAMATFEGQVRPKRP
jgi:hypothetical protein